MMTDYRKFHDVWVMNEEEAKELVVKLLEEDRIIHTQQLGLDYNKPDVSVSTVNKAESINLQIIGVLKRIREKFSEC